jgi:hypothetical protein
MMRTSKLASRVSLSALCVCALAGCGQTLISIDSYEAAASETEPEVTTPNPAPIISPDAGDAGRVAEPNTPPDLDLVAGLLLYLPFDETEAGAIAVDASGNGHDGTPSVDPPLPSPSTPAVGFDNPRCLAFNGGAQLIDLGNPAALNVEGELTVSAWIRPTALDGYRNIVAHGYRQTPGQEVVLRISDAYYEFLTWNGFMENHQARAPVPEGDIDNWHHLTGVFDGSRYRLYRDGVLLSEQADTFGPSAMDAPWAIGGRSITVPEDPRPFEGFIDEVRVYARALSGDEVRALFRR